MGSVGQLISNTVPSPSFFAQKVSIVTIVNIPTIAATEQSYDLPTGSKFLTIKTRTSRPYRIAFDLNGTNTSYIFTTAYSNLGLDPTIAFTVYLQSSVNGDVFEIETWK